MNDKIDRGLSKSFEISKGAISTGSKSFRLASLFLDSKSKRGAYLLYRWCRYADDLIDESTTRSDAESKLNELIEKTKRALLFYDSSDESPFSGLYELKKVYGVPEVLFMELLWGFKMDVVGEAIQNHKTLEKYCYHVAGVVGLMMSHILRANNTSATLHADYLGRAMQLTNIVRDIRADLKIGRVYLPYDMLVEYDLINRDDLISNKNKEKLYTIVLTILKKADEWYEFGRQGIVYLPFRASWSITVASFLYQGIGNKIKKNGPTENDSRVVLNFFEKFNLLLKGTIFFLSLKLKQLAVELIQRIFKYERN